MFSAIYHNLLEHLALTRVHALVSVAVVHEALAAAGDATPDICCSIRERFVRTLLHARAAPVFVQRVAVPLCAELVADALGELPI